MYEANNQQKSALNNLTNKQDKLNLFSLKFKIS